MPKLLTVKTSIIKAKRLQVNRPCWITKLGKIWSTESSHPV